MQYHNTQDNCPFTKELVQGAHQMEPVYFRLEVLERYRNDPRYQVRYFDFGGSIHVLEQSQGADTLSESDRIKVQRFGLAYQADGTRAIIVFLYRLAELSLEHQLYWLSYRMHGKCSISPDYVRTSINALPAENISAYQAFLQEQVVINKMAVEMDRPPLFRATYDQISNNGRPREFSAFIRPTLKNYSEFVHLLDKLLSDNLNQKFFRGEISSSKGTITMLDEWLRKEFRGSEEEVFSRIINPFRHVRSLRNEPAHNLEEDNYSPLFYRQQNELMKGAYWSVRSLRQLMHTHPDVQLTSVPDWMDHGSIVLY